MRSWLTTLILLSLLCFSNNIAYAKDTKTFTTPTYTVELPLIMDKIWDKNDEHVAMHIFQSQPNTEYPVLEFKSVVIKQTPSPHDDQNSWLTEKIGEMAAIYIEQMACAIPFL